MSVGSFPASIAVPPYPEPRGAAGDDGLVAAVSVRCGKDLLLQSGPALRAESLHGRDIRFVDKLRLGVGLNSPFDAGLAQQMQGRPRASIGGVAKIVSESLSKLKLRMKTRDLDFAFKLKLSDQPLAGFEKLVVLKKIA
jgi:hypothetical protein